MFSTPLLSKRRGFLALFYVFKLANAEPAGQLPVQYHKVSIEVKDVQTFQGSIQIPSTFPIQQEVELSADLWHPDYLIALESSVLQSPSIEPQLSWHSNYNYATNGSFPILNAFETTDIVCRSGDRVYFQFQNDGKNDWTISTSVNQGSIKSVSYAIQAPMMIGDLIVHSTDDLWTFGPVNFTNIHIVKTGTDTNWCDESSFSGIEVNYKVDGLNASVIGGNSACDVASIVISK